jgi:hypothetical protein
VKDGLKAIKTIKTVATLSNLPLRTQTQMVCRIPLRLESAIPTHNIFCRRDTRAYPGTSVLPARSSDLINRTRFNHPHKIVLIIPSNPDAYAEAARSMGLSPANCAVVSAHLDELRVAGGAGLKTIYVRRASEDLDVEAEVLSKLEGGEFDVVVDSFEHLAIVLGCGE